MNSIHWKWSFPLSLWKRTDFLLGIWFATAITWSIFDGRYFFSVSREERDFLLFHKLVWFLFDALFRACLIPAMFWIILEAVWRHHELQCITVLWENYWHKANVLNHSIHSSIRCIWSILSFIRFFLSRKNIYIHVYKLQIILEWLFNNGFIKLTSHRFIWYFEFDKFCAKLH